MSGVKFISIVCIVAAAFIWGGFVIHTWQKNVANRTATLTTKGEGLASGQNKTLERADEMAVAASEEFSELSSTFKGDVSSPKSIAKPETFSKKDMPLTDKPIVVVGQTQKTIEAPKKVAIKNAETLDRKDKKFVWVVPDANSPGYDDSKAVKVGNKPWRVPTGNDPISVNEVGQQITKIADGVKDNAAEAAEKVGKKISTLAGGVKAKIISDEKWRVPTGVVPVYKDRDVIADGTPKWRVPDGMTPSYESVEKGAARAKIQLAMKTDKLQSKKITGDVPRTEMIVSDASGDDAVVIKGKLEARLSDDQVETAAGVIKDAARLSKDLKTVPVEKYASDEDGKKVETVVAAAKGPTEKVVAVKKDTEEEKIIKKKPVWTVPTGKSPSYGVVATLERGIESVKEVAAIASNEIAEQVNSIGSNVKEAVASAKKWEVPTGVTWNEKSGNENKGVVDKAAVKAKEQTKKDPAKLAASKPDLVGDAQPKEIVVAELTKKDGAKIAAVKSKEALEPAKVVIANVPLPLKKAVPKKKAVAIAALPLKKKTGGGDAKLDETAPQEEPEMFVSSQMKRVGEEITGDAKSKIKVAAKDDSSAPGVVKRIINFLSNSKDGEKKVAQAEKKVSGFDGARLVANTKLALDDVRYKLTNARKGKGKISIAGRSQKGTKLALYVGPRYLGDVETDGSGQWAFEKELFLPKGQHIVHAQQMSDSGLVLARKTWTIVQAKAAKPPKGYDPGVGIGLGDKALKIMRDKLKDDKKPKKKLAEKSSKSSKKKQKVAKVDLPLPQRKVGEEKKKNNKNKNKKQQVAMLDRKKKSETKVEPKVAAARGPDVKLEQYVVKSGDTLSKIAKKIYGDTASYKKILLLNPKLKSANLIYPRQKLVVRGAEAQDAKKDPVKKVKVAGVPKKSVVPLKVSEAKTKSAEGPEIYRVKRGESLWLIAKKVYGNGASYKKLIKLNPQLANNPGLIRPNLKIKVRGS